MSHSDAFHIRRAAVLGAGVMGAQIAAHLTQAGVETVLFELAAKDGDPNGGVNKAIAGLAKLSPSPLATKSTASQIIAANYDQHLSLLNGCDLVIEAIAERMDWKKDLYAKIAPHLPAHAIIASNTSGLGINELASVLPEAMRHRFCGIHFFNPPRYMYLVELIPCVHTEPAVLDTLETFITSTVGKGVVRAKDTPNFIGNRIGVFSIVATMFHTERFGLGFDEVDAVTGPSIGRPKSATYRTCDVVGLDTMGHVIKTMADTLPSDPWHRYYQAPVWLKAMIDKGVLGQKTKAGFFKKVGNDIQVLDLAKQDYRPSAAEPDDDTFKALRKKTWGEKLAALRASNSKQSQFLWSCFRDLFHYSAYFLADIADNARDVDFAIRWGYGWNQGPFEIWQAAGWQQVAGWINEDIAAGKTMSNAPLPAWVLDGRDGVHSAAGSYSPTSGQLVARSKLAVYERQLYPDPILGEAASYGETVFETDAVRGWHQGDGVLILSFKTKMNTVSPDVLAGIQRAVKEAEAHFKALVLWQLSEPFSAGADLSAAIPLVATGQIAEFDKMVANFQNTSMAIKFSAVPVVVAVRGMALGGGCEFTMHSAKAVCALESYIGLVEAGVGLLPAGGGLKEIACRASIATGGGDVFPIVSKHFMNVAQATVATSALEARELGFLRPSDMVVFNSYELLYVAKNEALRMAQSGYRPPVPNRQIAVAGDIGIASLCAAAVNMLEGRFISEHDYEIAKRIATVICGGNIERGSLVDEQWLLDLEREHFIALGLMQKTQERIAHTLKTGKPLRN
jgi:3-hydroxyacyl-CoA dehydrogenase